MFGSRSRREGRFAALRAATRTPSPSSFALASFGGQVRERPARRSFSEGGGGVRARLAPELGLMAISRPPRRHKNPSPAGGGRRDEGQRPPSSVRPSGA